MLNWAKQFNIFCFLDSSGYSMAPQRFECLLAAGCTASIDDRTVSWTEADAFFQRSSWCFGHLSYELKNSFHHFSSPKKDHIGFPLFYFFNPLFLCIIKEGRLHIEAENPEAVYADIMQQPSSINGQSDPINIRSRLSKKDYINIVRQLQQHILHGDCYEINFCQEFFAKGSVAVPLVIFDQLMQVSPNPFSAFYKVNNSFLICASPERFLYKDENRIISQPMKGTAKRRPDNQQQDNDIKRQLYNNAKERAENVMVVDLVRNDLSKICVPSSVNVEELFGLYTFPQVHQMISTISGVLKGNVSFSEIIKALFPMGSMTGAPKHKVMQLIDQYEPGTRGIFSGSVGYIQPNGDFDFNVVIRSIMYNSSSRYLSYQVGSGITFYSEPEKEWEECLLKGEAMKKVLKGKR